MTTPPETPRPDPSRPDEPARPPLDEGTRLTPPEPVEGAWLFASEPVDGVRLTPSEPVEDPRAAEDERPPAPSASAALRRDRAPRGAEVDQPAWIGSELGTEAPVDAGARDGGAMADGGSPDVSGLLTPPRVHDGGPTSGTGAHDDGAVLGARTYDRVLEPRSQRRLPLGDGTWYQLARAYVRVQLISQGVFFLLVVAVAVAVQVITGVLWQWIPAGIVLVVTLFGLVITPRQARSFGYQLRRDDLVFRRGILWQRVVAVPYGRMQLVDITHGPLDRGFGIAQLKLVTAAASTGVTIPGLTQEAAEHLRDTLVAVAETRRTGL